MMKIAILNESFLTKYHIQQLQELGEVVTYEQTDTEAMAIERLKDADIAVMDGFICPMNHKVLNSSNHLKFIALNHTGYDMVDLETAQKKGITISHVPGFSTESVAEHVIALMFAVIRHIPQIHTAMHTKPFEIDPGNAEQKKYLGWNIRGKTLGVIGLGSIGMRVVELGSALGMHVIGYNRTPKNVSPIEIVSLDELLQRSDVVSINLALAPTVQHFIGEKELALMKPSAIIINTARGAHVDTQALFTALRDKKIAGAGLDVLENWTDANPLLTLENVVLTPHEAFFTHESLTNMADIITSNIQAFVKGKPVNIAR